MNIKNLHKEKKFEETRIRLADEGFAVKECTIAGETCFLIYPPNMGIEWNEDNLIYRSGIWNYAGQPVSLSWKKFFNWDEQPELAPKPLSMDECSLINKEDGSTLIVSRYKGELVMRTRGATHMEILDNGNEKELLIAKYPKFFKMIDSKYHSSSKYSWVFEWETPSNRIVIDYGDEPRLVLTGIINNEDYSYKTNDLVDLNAKNFHLERPHRYSFDTFDSMQEAMEDLKGIEGICVYYNGDQDIKKMKTSEYLMYHSVKFKLGYKALIEMIYEENAREEEFKQIIEDRFDYEGLHFVEDLIEQIYLADYVIKEAIDHDFKMIMLNRPPSKKEFAQIVFNGNERYKAHSGFLFKMYETRLDLRHILMANESLCVKFKKMIMDFLKR